MSDPLLTAVQVGELLGVPTSWVYEQSRYGVIPTVTLGRYRRYRREAVQVWIEEREQIQVWPSRPATPKSASPRERSELVAS